MQATYFVRDTIFISINTQNVISVKYFQIPLTYVVGYFYKISLNISDTLSNKEDLHEGTVGWLISFIPKQNVIMSRKIGFQSCMQ